MAIAGLPVGPHRTGIHSDNFHGPRHNRNPSTHILWRYDVLTGNWQEVCRCEAIGLEWIHIITPAAVHLLREGRQTLPRPDLLTIIRDIADKIEDQLFSLDRADRVLILGALHDYFTARVAIQSGPWEATQLDMWPYFEQYFRTDGR